MCLNDHNFNFHIVVYYITSYDKTWLVGKPKPDRKNITLGVTDQSGIEFSTTVISFPEPGYNLKNENGTINIKMKDTFTRNAVNNFTIHFNQTIVDHDDYGSYSLTIYNTFGETNVIVNVIPQSKYKSYFFIWSECAHVWINYILKIEFGKLGLYICLYTFVKLWGSFVIHEYLVLKSRIFRFVFRNRIIIIYNVAYILCPWIEYINIWVFE